jgi:hypothetical protein
MKDFAFKVNLVAVVRVRAGDESVAREIVPTVLGAPSTAEIRLANENNAATGSRCRFLDRFGQALEKVRLARRYGRSSSHWFCRWPCIPRALATK